MQCLFKAPISYLTLLLVSVCACSYSDSVWADSVTVAVAANFSHPIKAIAKEFEHRSGHTVKLSLGASGKIAAQITQGAPFDLFLSADQARPELLIKKGLAVKGSRFTYALGNLVLWSATAGLIDKQGDILKQGGYNKLALANPKFAPYGLAALNTLTQLKLVDQTRAKWVFGENISQTFQFVSTGNADIGFVSMSQVTSNGAITKGSGWIVPKHLYQPIQQDLVLLKKSAAKPAALSFHRFMSSEKARLIINSYGYDTPKPGVTRPTL